MKANKLFAQETTAKLLSSFFLCNTPQRNNGNLQQTFLVARKIKSVYRW